MSGYLNQFVLSNLPEGLRRVEPGGPLTMEQDQWVPVTPTVRSRLRVRSFIQSIADLEQVQALERIVERFPPSPALRDLQALREEEQETEEPISHHAYDKAEKVVRYLDTVIGADLQLPHLAPDGGGGIRMEWFQGDANIRVVIPAREDRLPYIYFALNGVSEVSKLSNALLFEKLRLHIMPRPFPHYA
jgi:hypothetical protein